MDVPSLLAEGRHREIAEYCLRDVVATVELHKICATRLMGSSSRLLQSLSGNSDELRRAQVALRVLREDRRSDGVPPFPQAPLNSGCVPEIGLAEGAVEFRARLHQRWDGTDSGFRGGPEVHPPGGRLRDCRGRPRLRTRRGSPVNCPHAPRDPRV